MGCRTLETCKFKRKQGFRLHAVIKTKYQITVRSIKEVFGEEGIQNKYGVLNYSIDFSNFQQKLMNLIIMIVILTMKQKDKFIRTNPNGEKFNERKAVNKI